MASVILFGLFRSCQLYHETRIAVYVDELIVKLDLELEQRLVSHQEYVIQQCPQIVHVRQLLEHDLVTRADQQLANNLRDHHDECRVKTNYTGDGEIERFGKRRMRRDV